MSRILVVDDEISMRLMLQIFFNQQGHEVDLAADGNAGVQHILENEYDLVITDLRMPGAHGMVVLDRCLELQPDTPIIVMTAYATTDTAIKAMKMGAYDYFTKPFKNDELKIVIDKALERRELVRENRRLKARLTERDSMGGIVGRSQQMSEIFSMIQRVASTRTNVLILGASGTGKELVARAVHAHSDRKNMPFKVVNCGAIPENLLESELFGHKKGAFTGATSDQIGLFQAAHGGTLLLDEVGEMPLAMQVKLLRVLQERKIKAVGDHSEVSVDVRVLAATNRELEEDVAAHRFREDLYYRLNVISIEIPPLRDRPSDIPLLAHYFLRKYSKELNKDVDDIDPDVLQALMRHEFSGNVRELENIIERAVALVDGNCINMRSLPPMLRDTESFEPDGPLALNLPPEGVNLEGVVDQLERNLINQALDRTGGRKKDAARLLGISFRSLRYRLEKLKM